MEEKTLVILKPDCRAQSIEGTVIDRIQKAGLRLTSCKTMQLEETLLKEHYAHLLDKPFFPDIVAYMTSRPVIAMIFEGENAIEIMRETLGPTDSTKAPAGTIRGDYGKNISENIAHASDSPKAAEEEIKRFFKAEEIF